jgi:hypothetical protein
VSTAGGHLPLWSPNGQELFYRTEDQWIMAVILICLQWNTGNPIKASEGGNPQRICF